MTYSRSICSATVLMLVSMQVSKVAQHSRFVAFLQSRRASDPIGNLLSVSWPRCRDARSGLAFGRS